jgi:branched-chain amino acid transport system permease protein
MMPRKKIPWDILTIILFLIVAPMVFANSYFFDTINIIGIYAIAVIGLNLVLGFAGLFSMGHAAFFGLGSYISALISINYGLNPFLSVLISCILVGIISYIIAIPLLRLKGYFLALGTLSISVISQSLINGANNLTGGPRGMAGIPSFSIGDFTFSSMTEHFYLIWITVLVVYIIVKNIVNSKEGRAMKAIHSDEDASASFGIDVPKLKLKVFVFGSVIGALGGAYYGHYMLFISPEIVGLNTSINFLIMGFIGGLGSFIGPILGAFAFQIIPEISAMALEYELLIKGVIFLLIVILFSGGLVSVLERFASLFKRKKVDNTKKSDEVAITK